MFSKTAKEIEGVFQKSRAAISLRSLSIIGRLTLFYMLAVLGTLTIATAFLYRVLSDNLQKANTEFLIEKMDEFRNILGEHANEKETLEELEEELRWEGEALQFTKYYLRVVNENGRTLVETPGMGTIVAAKTLAMPSHRSVESITPFVWKSKGSTYLVMAAWAEPAHKESGRHVLQLALDISGSERLLADYRWKLALMLLLGVLSSMALGVAIARKGMRPLQDMTKSIERISATRLHQRIGMTGWPKELTAVAGAFDRMLNRLEDSFTRLSQFSADLAHELRTPISNLRGGAEVALSRSRTEQEYRQVLESSLEEYDKLTRMIDNLLFLARTESMEIRPTRSLFEVRKELNSILEFYDALAQEQRIEISCQNNAFLNADRVLFRRAISNILSNAFQYTPTGGKVTICMKESDDGFVEICISDTGIGIESDCLPRIFDRFYRTDRGRSEYPEGTGLGLAIVNSIMQLHEGSVAILSEPGRGTVVTLRFPQSVDL